jgi:hypothetical protein
MPRPGRPSSVSGSGLCVAGQAKAESGEKFIPFPGPMVADTKTDRDAFLTGRTPGRCQTDDEGPGGSCSFERPEKGCDRSGGFDAPPAMALESPPLRAKMQENCWMSAPQAETTRRRASPNI